MLGYLLLFCMLVAAALFARSFGIAQAGIGQVWIPKTEAFIGDLTEGATGPKTCECCTYAGSRREFRRVGNVLLCADCSGFTT